MLLTNGDPDMPRRFSGPGHLGLDEHGHLQLVLYDTNYDPELKGMTGMRGVGEWVAESDIYELEATDLSGRIWQASNLTVGVDIHVARRGAVVRARLDSLSSETECEHEGADWIRLFFPHKVKGPRNVSTITTVEEADTRRPRRGSTRDIWAIKCGSLDLRIRFRETGLEVSASAGGGALPREAGAIIEETIWFTLGQPVRADIVQYRRGIVEGIVIHRRGRDEALSLATPPYHIQIRDSAAVLEGMFCKYLSHVSRDRQGRYYPLSVLVRKALRAEAGTLEEAALARCVAIEGVTDLEFQDLGRPTDETLAAVSTLEDLLGEHLKLSPIKDRVKGFLGVMKGYSSRSAIRALAKQGVITDQQLAAWETLRHTAAHGHEYQLPHREVFELLERLRVLMNRLVFQAIGYDGAYTDYGSRGWPTRTHGDMAEPAEQLVHLALHEHPKRPPIHS